MCGKGRHRVVCFIVAYTEQVERMLKQNTGLGGFLGTFHTLLSMNDMAILATSREMCLRKQNTVLDFCLEY